MITLTRILGGIGFIARGAVTSVINNVGLALLSLLLALSLWLFVTERENPQEVQAFNSSIPIELANVPEDLAVANVDETGVRIEIEAPRNELNGLSAEDFEAVVNLGGFQRGRQSVAVDVTPPNSRIRVVDVTPARVEVTLESRRSREVPVKVSSVGSPVTGFAVVSERAEPETVTVSGPESLVALVDSAVAVVNLTGARVDITDDRVELEPRDASDGGISRVTVSPETARVTVDLEQREFSLEFAVNPTVTGEPADGFNVTGIEVEPRLVRVTGTLDALQQIDVIRGLGTADVPISDVRDDVTRTVDLDLPDGVRAVDSASVRVTVSIAAARGEFSYRVVPQVRNPGDGLVVVPAGSVTVTLTGEVPVLEDISAASIAVSVDADGLGPGLYALPVEITAPPDTTVTRIDPPEMGVAITLQE